MNNSDNNLVDFLYRFSSELRCFLPKTSKSLEMLSLPFQPDSKTLFKSMLNELHQNTGSAFYLIFDDFHIITNSDFHDMLVESLIFLETGVINTFIISRHKPLSAYSRLRARQKFFRLDKQYLHWNENEVIALSRILSDGKVSDDFGKAYYKITNGWVSGVILLIATLRENPVKVSDLISLNKEFLFEYFANEIFETMNNETQKLLMKASFLYEIHAKQDKHLLDNNKLKIVFEDLCNRNYFTSNSGLNKHIYSFHPLFKEFLQNKSRKYFHQDEISRFKREVASHLNTNVKYENAIALYIEIGDWKNSSTIIIQQADNFLSQGKRHLILQYINQFDRDAYDSFIWLQYWEAICYLAIDPNKSYAIFIRLFNIFQKRNDPNGEYYAICGVLESVIFSFNYYDRLMPWIEIVSEKYTTNIKPKGIELQARLSANMHTALLFSHPAHKDLKKWEKKVCLLMKLLKVTLNTDHRVLVGVNLFYQYLISGEKLKAEKILLATNIENPNGTRNPVSQGAWYVMAALNAWTNGYADQAKQAADAGLKIAEDSGSYFWFNLLLLQKTYACLSKLELNEAHDLLSRVARRSDSNSQLITGMYYDAFSQLEYLQGDLDSALENIELCMNETRKMNMVYALPGYQLGLVEIQIARGEYNEAKKHLKNARKESECMRSDLYLYRCSLLETQLSLAIGDQFKAKKNMDAAMSLAESRGFESHPGWNAKNISKLYEFSLSENISTNYVIHCIRKRNLQVNINLFEHENWDWSVKIYTLGGLRIVINHTSLAITGKSQRKPIMLLKAILSFGLWRISQPHLAGKLWPDADGAESLQSLYTTTHRLRRLLGTKAILVKDGYVGLNPDIVWVDTGLAKYYVSKIESTIHHRQTHQKQTTWVTNLLNLYAGQFLENELDDVWCFQHSKELHNKVLSSLSLYAHDLREKYRYDEALVLFEKICQLDILNEKNYYDQISLLIFLKRYPEAIAIYNECCSLLSRVLGVMPSARLSQLLNNEITNLETLTINY
ncbi:MAG: hypothetical protein GXP14_06285 [Gammaproteobacteria bacterium]|nr:hypothetical protein [Gammaproteobacteria bacterium]